MDIKQAADRLIDIKNGKLPDVDGAYEWLKTHSWDNIANQWDQLLDRVMEDPMQINTIPTLNRAERRKLAKTK